MTKRAIMQALAAIGALALVAFGTLYPVPQRAAAQADAAAELRPNIVVIMADDLDVGSLETMLEHGLMPNLVRYLIDAGTTFTNSFVSTSLCCPSRATFLTGRYSHNHNVLNNYPPIGGVTRLDDSSTVATVLQAAGYRTAHVGKYLNGYGADRDATSIKDDPGYIPPGWDDWQTLVDDSTYRVYEYTINDNGSLVAYGTAPADYQTDVLALRAAQFIDKAETLGDAQPFFLLVTPLAPHVETDHSHICPTGRWMESIRPAPRHVGTLPATVRLPQRPSLNEQNVDDKPSQMRRLTPMTAMERSCASRQYRDRLESLRAVDDLIGTIVGKLSENGELDDTVIVFTSDNGWFSGEHRLTDKKWFFEEGIRVPLVVRAPGYPAQTSAKLVLNNDLAPTIAAFANIAPPPAVDGRSLMPLIQTPSISAWRQRILVEFRADISDVPAFVAVRTSAEATLPDRLYAELDDGQRQYYDMNADPYQLQSKHNNPSTLAERRALARHLNRLRVCAGDDCRIAEDE